MVRFMQPNPNKPELKGIIPISISLLGMQGFSGAGPNSISAKNKRRLLALSLGLFFFSIYLFIYRGGFHSIDEVAIFAVTDNLTKLGRFNIDQIAWIQWTTTQAEAQGFFGQDGHVYSKKGLALSLAQAPLYWLALHLPGIGMLQTVSLLNALVTAATGLLIFMFLHRLNFSVFTTVATSLIFGLATIAAVYTKYLFSEPLAGFLLLLAAYMLFTYRQEGGLHHIAIAGLAAGFAILTRANNLFLLPVFGLYLIWIVIRRGSEAAKQQMTEATSSSSAPLPLASRIPALSPSFVGVNSVEGTHHVSRFTYHRPTLSQLNLLFTPLAVFIMTTVIAGVILMGYNAIRSGNPLDTGYDLTLFSPNILLGLYKLLFSPLRGLFIYSPILLLSLPGWWYFRKIHPAEAWLCVGLVGVTIGLFSAWSSGEGLSWGSRFLVPVVPFFVISLAPLMEKVSSAKCQVLRFTFYVLLPLSLLIQLLGIAINPWVFLSRLQADFGGEFFLENTAALYDFRYTQIVGQIESWSLENSDLAWWQPWGFDWLAFGLSLGLVLFSGWLLWRQMTADRRLPTTELTEEISPLKGTEAKVKSSPLLLCSLAPLLLVPIITYALLARYYRTDQQFGPPPNDAYTRALETAVAESETNDQIVTVAQYHYHVPMNRFKARVPLTGFAQQSWPPPQTTLPLLRDATAGQNVWLVTIGFQPAAPDNAAERWLARNVFKASDEWLDESVRLVHYTTRRPSNIRPIKATLGEDEAPHLTRDKIQLVEVNLVELLQPGQGLPVEFVWLPLTQPSVDYNLFLQLLDADGRLVAQHDSPPDGGYSPTSTWQPNEPITTRHALILPSDLQPGDYRLIAGLYNPATGERLSVVEGSDFVALGNINIQHSNE
jgi:hypothetical protein